MSNTEKGRRQKAEGRRQPWRVPLALHSALVSRRIAYCLLLTAFCLLSAGCRMDMQDQPKYKTYRAGDEKFGIKGASVRPLVEGTVPRRASGAGYRDHDDYFYTGRTAGQAGATSGGAGATGGMQMGTSADASAAVSAGAHVHGASETTAATGGPDVFPINIERADIERGRERFQIYCVACHGFTGEGDGMIVRRGFRKPPSYYEDRLQEGTTPASHFFDVITNGWGAMSDYSAQIEPGDRWKIIAYIRALQLSRRVKFDELSPEARQKVLDSMHKPSGGHEGGSTELQSPQTGGTSPQVEGNH
jgi:mono/diheme cytochrome c family protein